MSEADARNSARESQTSRAGAGPDADQKFNEISGGIKNEIARNQLRTVIGRKNAPMLEKSIDVYKTAATNEGDGSLITGRAVEELQYLRLRDELYAAMESRDLNKMYEICQRVESSQYRKFKDPLTPDLMQARKLISILNRKVKLPDKLDFDDKTMREMRRYAAPPQIVHDIAVAAFLLLNEYEGHTRDWNKCREIMKPYGKPSGFSAREGLRWRVENFNPESSHPELAARSKQILDRYTLSHAYEVSEACAAFFVWAKTQLNEMELENENPANLRRQREILGINDPSEPHWMPRPYF